MKIVLKIFRLEDPNNGEYAIGVTVLVSTKYYNLI